MELITNIIIEYLKHNKRLVVPKLGAFIVKQPGNKILFSELMRGEDNTLRSLLVAYGMSELEATGHIDRLVFEIRIAIGNGESFTIENLGSFSAGDNNNIIFKQHRDVKMINGNIKPPFDSLAEAKRKMRLASDGGQPRVATPKEVKVATTTRRPATTIEESLNISKPDSYLRGLKYENKKDKGRDSDHRSTSSFVPQRRMMLLIFGVALICATIFIIWYFWSGDDNTSSTSVAVKQRVEVADSVEMTHVKDTTIVDQQSNSIGADGSIVKDIL